jgi:hypothetical protein
VIASLSLAVKIAALATAVVALASGALSWDALQWGAGELGIDRRLTWLFPVSIDGAIVVGTVAALALRAARPRVRLYVWTLLGAGIAASVVGNGAHAAGDNPLHRIGAAVPAAALAASLHLLVILVRTTRASAGAAVRVTPVRARSPQRARRRARAPERPVVLDDGRQVSAGHARKLAARARLAAAS